MTFATWCVCVCVEIGFLVLKTDVLLRLCFFFKSMCVFVC